MMNKFLSLFLVWACVIQDGLSAASIDVYDQDTSSPLRRSSSLKYELSLVGDSERTLREGASKRPREDSVSISSSDRRTPPPRTDRHVGTRFEFSDSHKNTLRQNGISELQISRIELLQTALFRSPHGKQSDPRSYLTENEFDAICKKIGSKEVRLLVGTLKSLYDKKIPLAGQSPNTIYTPAARLSCTEGDDPKAKNISDILAACEGIHVEHVTGNTFIEEETPETPEERSARHALKAQLFKTLEENRGISEASRLSELSTAEQTWSKYFEYMQLRVKAIDQQISSKIRGREIEEIFKELLDSIYSSIKVGDCTVYFRKEEVDLDRTNIDQKTNLLLLAEGLAPIGADGEPMELHHLTRRHPGVLVLMTQNFHQKNTTLLHLRSEKHMRQPQPVDRAVFASWKKIAFVAILAALVPKTEEEFDPAVRLFSETDLQSQDEETM